MNPKPFWSLNHFTVPVSLLICFAFDQRRQNPQGNFFFLETKKKKRKKKENSNPKTLRERKRSTLSLSKSMPSPRWGYEYLYIQTSPEIECHVIIINKNIAFYVFLWGPLFSTRRLAYPHSIRRLGIHHATNIHRWI